MTEQEMMSALREHFPPDEVGWLPKSTSGNRCLAFAYIDSRSVQRRLDAVFGLGGWQTDIFFTGTNSCVCRLTVRVAEGQWVTRTDVGGEDGEADSKAAASDSLKRAAVQLGIGRYLYEIGGIWVDYDPIKKCIIKPPSLPEWALPRQKPNLKAVAAALAVLETAARKGREAFSLAWKNTADEMRKAVGPSMPNLKLLVEAADKTRAQNAQPDPASVGGDA